MSEKLTGTAGTQGAWPADTFKAKCSTNNKPKDPRALEERWVFCDIPAGASGTSASSGAVVQRGNFLYRERTVVDISAPVGSHFSILS